MATVQRKKDVSCAEWALIVGTKPIEGAVKKNLKKGDIVFEYDFKKYGSKNNPGVGPCLGMVKEINKRTVSINWADDSSNDDVEEMRYKDVRLAPGFDDDVVTKTATYRLVEQQVRGSCSHPHTLHSHPNGLMFTSAHTSLTSERINVYVLTHFMHIRTDFTDIRECVCSRVCVCV